jgi:glycosyltransferase involved in cell wall biosynthesis
MPTPKRGPPDLRQASLPGGSVQRSLSILIPCLNEEMAVAGVITEFRDAFPEARILVVDNGSVDDTPSRARAAGADVLVERRRGKGQAVATAFSRLDSDIVIMVDGDGSYPAEGARRLLEAYLVEPVDMVTGIRTPSADDRPFRPLHRIGSWLFAQAMRFVFSYNPGDLFSGLRLFSKRFYRNVPLLFRGFELETELTIQAVEKGFRLAEAPIPFRDRAAGTSSKLRTLRDGFRILHLLLVLFRDYKPFVFFSAVSGLFVAAGLAAGYLPIREYLETRMVGRFPLAILAAALMNLALFCLLTGIMLESNLRHRREAWQIELRNFRP